MKSIEEIVRAECSDEMLQKLDTEEMQYLKDAMNEWAKIVAKEFPEWMEDEDWVKSQTRSKYWQARDDIPLKYLSFDELFEMFLIDLKK